MPGSFSILQLGVQVLLDPEQFALSRKESLARGWANRPQELLVDGPTMFGLVSLFHGISNAGEFLNLATSAPGPSRSGTDCSESQRLTC